MAIEFRGNILVLDEGSAATADLVERVDGIFPNVYRLSADATGDDHVLAVGRKHLDIKTVVRTMAEREAYWALVPKHRDPVVIVADYLSAARPLLANGFPAFVLVAAEQGRRYQRIALIADVQAPITTGSLALAGVGMAWRSGASLDVLLLGADAESVPTSWAQASELFTVSDDAEHLRQAVAKAQEIGLQVNWVPLGGSANRDQLALDAVREGDYDLVLDDLRPMDIGPRIGRLKRVQRQLLSGDSIDTAYRLLRDAPCDVGIVVDAVNMNMVPDRAVKFGAVAALSLGMMGAAGATVRVDSAAAAGAAPTTVEAPLDPSDPDAAPAEQAAPAVAAPEAVGVPSPAIEQIPQEVSSDLFAQADAAYAQEQATLAQEQAELTALQQQQATADQEVAIAEADLALAQQDAASARATVDSAEDRLDYAENSNNDLSDSEQMQALGSVNRATHDLDDKEAAVADAEAAVAASQEAAEAAAMAVSAQQGVVGAQSANVDDWTAVMTEAETRTDQVVSPAPGYSITTHYGESGSNWSSGHHTGTDFAAPTGAEVDSVADGSVVYTGWSGPYGNQVQVQHEDGTITTYNHLNSITVSTGQTVSAGQQIGTVGSTGNSTGPHLHFEVHDANGATLDSDAWLAANGVS